MKKKLITLLIFFTLILAACGSSLSATQASSAQENASLPTETTLIVGTLKLEGTQQTVTSEQAKELLYMWKAYRVLYNSDNTAQAEIDGLIKQIRGTMTTGQIEAISAMNLAQQDVSALIQEQEIQISGSGSASSGGSSALPTGAGSAPPDGGGMPGDMPMGTGMEGMLDAGQTTSSAQSQPAAPGAASSTGATTALVEALIQVLEQKISI